ncbi:MAG: hypothetical protein JNM68_07335, partial [Dinghuibacter sp.]|nr:hypothetical protein [Dinghuibacter sp.]
MLAFFGVGCKMARYPTGKPYVYKVKINVVGQYKEDEKKRLEKQLEKQLDDSLRASKEQKKALRFIPYYQKVYHEFDTSSIARTGNFFRYAYVANGYFRGGATTYRLDTLNKETGRLELTFTVRPYKNHRIDTVIYDIQDSSLQELAMRHRDATLIFKNDLYSQELLNAERNRLANLYRNNGYLRITRDNFKVIADTINRSLFVFTTDPLEQAALMYEASKFDENPTTTVTFTLNTPLDSSRLKKYYIGNIDIFPDNADRDTIPPNSERINNHITKSYFKNTFQNKIFPPQIYLKKGALYRQSDYDKTYNALNYLGAWQQVNITPRDSLRSDTVDFSVYMLPYRKYQGERRLEGSYNQSNGSGNTQIGNLWGVNISQLVKNRNLARQAIQTTFEARAGIEFRGSNPNDANTSDQQFVNAGEFSLTYDMLFPKFLPNRQKEARTLKKFWGKVSVPKTLLSVNSRYSERFKFFQLAEVNFSHAYLFKFRDDYNISASFINVERKFLVDSDSLKRRIARYPILAFIFNDGFILGQKFSISRTVPAKTRNKRSVTGTWRFSFENSGLPVSFIPLKEFRNNLFNFTK